MAFSFCYRLIIGGGLQPTSTNPDLYTHFTPNSDTDCYADFHPNAHAYVSYCNTKAYSLANSQALTHPNAVTDT